ncbi:MAG: transcriptional repressor LexA [Chloroflexi bacterium]|nr:transcriptional repressor LexA [Chloroflexota bacterium]
MKNLSDKQQKILKFMREFVNDKGYPPTIRDIVKACSISSTSVVDYNLTILEKLGYIHRDNEVSRGIDIYSKVKGNMVQVPILGTIAAGKPFPVPDINSWDMVASAEKIEIASELINSNDEIYALKVKGTSMIDALIDDGDVVIMQKASTAIDSEMVAVWLKNEGEATLKKFYREAGRIRLQPANTQMKPIYAKPDNVEIQGKVVGVIRKY